MLFFRSRMYSTQKEQSTINSENILYIFLTSSSSAKTHNISPCIWLFFLSAVTAYLDTGGHYVEPAEGEDGERQDAPGRPIDQRVHRAEHQRHLQ